MKKVLSLVLALVMLLSMCALCACSGEPTKFDSNEARLQYVAQKNVKEQTSSALNVYDKAQKKVTDEDLGKTEIEMKVEVAQDLVSLLSNFLGTGETAIDLSFLKNITVKSVSNKKGDLANSAFSLLLNGKELLNLDAFFGDKTVALRVPLITDEYFSVDLEKLLESASGLIGGNDYDDYDDYDDEDDTSMPVSGKTGLNISGLLSLLGPLVGSTSLSGATGAAPDKEVVERIRDRYVDAITSAITGVEVGEEELTVGEIKEKLISISAKLDGQGVTNVAKAVLTVAKTDEDIKKIVNDCAPTFKGLLGENVNVYDEFVKLIDKALESANKVTADDLKSAPTIEFTVYTNKKNEIKAGKFSVSIKGETVTGSVAMLEDGDNYAFDAKVNDPTIEKAKTIAVTSTGTKKSDKLTGNFTIKFDGKKLCTVGVENLDTEAFKEGNFYGKVTINVGELFTYISQNGDNQSLGMASLLLANLNVSIEGSGKEHDLTEKVVIANGKAALLTITASLRSGKADNISAVSPTKSMEDVMQNVNLSSLLEKLVGALKEAGVPESLLESLGNFGSVEYLD